MPNEGFSGGSMQLTVLRTVAAGVLITGVSMTTTLAAASNRVTERRVIATGVDSGPYHAGPPETYDKHGPILTIIGGQAAVGRNHVKSLDSGGFIGTVDYGRGDTWTDTPTGEPLPTDDFTCPSDFPFPFKTAATITGGTGRFAGATGTLLIRTCNKVAGAGDATTLTTVFTITGTIRS
jgi:hypothetical protein